MAVGNVGKSRVFSSGQPEKTPISETDKQIPINPYGESKLCFEKALRWYSDVHGLKYAALRYFNAAGASEQFGEDHDPETHLIPILLQVAAGKREKAMLFGDDYDTPDGTCIRDYIHVTDLASAHLLALHHLEKGEKSDFFNLGNTHGTSVLEVVDAVRRVTGKEFQVTLADRRPGDPAKLVGSSDKAQRVLGWKPIYGEIDTIVAHAWNWYQKADY